MKPLKTIPVMSLDTIQKMMQARVARTAEDSLYE